MKSCREKGRNLKEQTSVLFFRFYIESISFLKDKTTVELFFLNAKACVHKVRAPFVMVSDRLQRHWRRREQWQGLCFHVQMEKKRT